MMISSLPRYSSQAQAKFWLQICSSDKLSCWQWTGNQSKDGYGIFGDCRVHRIAYYLWYSHDPLDSCVCHTCDNPICCNPYHLWLGTNADNTRDKVLKNRQARGEGNNRAKLTEDDVRAILSIGYSQGPRETSELFGMNYRTISAILTGSTWKHIHREFVK